MTTTFDASPIETGIPALCPADLAGQLRAFVARSQAYRGRHLQSAYEGTFEGYSFAGQTDSMNQGPEDALHSFVFSDFQPASAYPEEFQRFLAEDWEEVTRLAGEVERNLLEDLGIRDIVDQYEDHFGHLLSANYYPPAHGFEGAGGPRLTEHPDVSLLTVFPFGVAAGFEYQDANGNWRQFENSRCVCVFAGELLEWLTAGTIKALNHRVRRAPDERFSFSLFSLPRPSKTVRRPLPNHKAGTQPEWEEISVEAYIDAHLSRWLADESPNEPRVPYR